MKKEQFEAGFVWKNGALHPFNSAMGEECERVMKPGGFYIVEIADTTDAKSLSWQQMKSIHLWLGQVARKMSESGIDMKTIFDSMRNGFQVEPTKELLKESLWRPMQQAVLDVSSTRELSSSDVNAIYERLNSFFNREFGIRIPFPDRYNQSLDSIDER